MPSDDQNLFSLSASQPGPYSYKWNKYPKDILPLWVGDMDFASPPCVAQAVIDRARADHFGYEFHQPELTAALCRWLKEHHQWEVAPESVLLFTGVMSAIHLTLNAFAGRHRGFIAMPPLYAPLLALGKVSGRTLHAAPWRLKNGSYSLDLDTVEDGAKEGAHWLVLCNPHNPLGRCFTAEELRGLADLAEKYDLWVISDDIWADLVYAPAKYTPAAVAAPQLKKRLITMLAPTKTFNLPGAGISFAVVEDQEMHLELSRRLTGLRPDVNTFGRSAALAAYTQGEPWRQALLQVLAVNRALCVRFAREVLKQDGFTPPEATYFAWLDFSRTAIASDPCRYLFDKAKVALSNGAEFGKPGPGYCRLNFACPTERLKQGLARIADSL